ncbi:class I SAM-dependent methyltransferase [Niveibacterium sp.]|uniref:class I SAM-dependent methyltransferase n=1 Tax=Niveibacterium sp. TaxID=2017444 RepID=UPI0035AE151A
MSIPGCAAWLETPLGRYLIDWELAQVDARVADVFGFHAIQIGLPERDYLRNNRIGFKFRCARSGEVALISDTYELPIASQSVDLVVLPHVLEFSEHPHQVLREVERVLVPEGQVLITAFNPVSLWGARRLLAASTGEFPWQGQFLSVRRMKDWLALLSFESQPAVFGAYIPPVTPPRWIEQWNFMDNAGPRWWPFAGGAYLIQATKRVRGMRLVAPAWRDRRARAKAFAPVAQRDPVSIERNIPE